jgi:beta-lactam-binding protein with PASTA domain/predicted Ser/Thr protein kinase
MAVSDTLIGALFDGRYRILRRIGSGGMADVYLAEDQELGRKVAIKILNDRHAGDEQFVERFRREAKNAASLSHANIVSIYDRGEAEGTYYIAMEHIDGRSLKELIVSRGPAPVPVAIEYARSILQALRFAHKRGIVHRDIKPHNVLDDGDGRVKVTDFGIARAGASQMTEAGSIVGTAQYLSPEQARGAPVDARSDLYSLGIVLYELLTGKVPFSGDSPVEIAMKHLSAHPEPPSAHRPDIPRDLDLVVLRALAKDPGERYQSADEMDADLARIEQGLSVSSRTAEAETRIMTAPTAVVRPATTATRQRVSHPPPAPPPPVYYDVDEPPPRRRSLWPWLVALLLLAGAIVAGAYVYDQIQDELDESRPVAVPFVEGTRRLLAEARIREAGLKPVSRYEFHDEVPVGNVIDQNPDAGDRIDRGNRVNLLVSLGREQVEVPDVRGRTATDAVAVLAEAGLKANPVEINSDKEEDTVTAQDPPPGRKLPKGETVRINVSKGPKPVQVPSVVGQAYEDASATLQGAGFAVARRDVDSNQPAGIVVAQDPAPGALVPKDSSVALSVSKGPPTRSVPSVEGFDREEAVRTLEESGFQVAIEEEPVDDESFENLVLSQDPAPGTEAEPGSTVTIVVGVPPD